MLHWFKKICIKDYESTDNPKVRLRYGVTAGVFGLLSNVALFIAKIAIGIFSGSITVIADAINNLSDAGSSIITLFGFKLSSKPADKEHPFGHARYEYISGILIAIIVLSIGLLLGKSSIEKIISPVSINVSALTYIVLSAAVVIKLLQMLIYLDFGKAISSESLKAAAADSRNDIISTFAVILASAIIQITNLNIDGYMGLAVSLFIVISSVKLIRETIDPLLGTMPDKTLVDKIEKKLRSYNGVLGFHDLMLHCYGATQIYAFVHIEVDASVNAMISHDMIDNIERDFMKDLGIHLSAHTDPIVLDDPMLDSLKLRVAKTMVKLNENLTIHDFRMVRGETHSNLLFDVVVPYGTDVSREAIHNALIEEFSDDKTVYYFVFNIDRSYVI